MTILRFPRATRDDCTRSAEPIQGPYLNNGATARIGRLIARLWRYLTKGSQ